MSLRRLGLLCIFALLNFSSFVTAAVTGLPVNEDLPDGWTQINPGGATTCARGDDFAFFVAEGRTDKVVIDFIGGGACWNSSTCAKETATFADSIDFVLEHYRKGPKGIYDRARLENPVRDWTHVVIPYCTGDIHWGDARVTYQKESGQQIPIAHKGAVNARAVLDWVQQNLTSPDKILVTGCSRSYGSIYWTP